MIKFVLKVLIVCLALFLSSCRLFYIKRLNIGTKSFTRRVNFHRTDTLLVVLPFIDVASGKFNTRFSHQQMCLFENEDVLRMVRDSSIVNDLGICRFYSKLPSVHGCSYSDNFDNRFYQPFREIFQGYINNKYLKVGTDDSLAIKLELDKMVKDLNGRKYTEYIIPENLLAHLPNIVGGHVLLYKVKGYFSNQGISFLFYNLFCLNMTSKKVEYYDFNVEVPVGHYYWFNFTIFDRQLRKFYRHTYNRKCCY